MLDEFVDITQCLTVFGFGGETETESPPPKPIQKDFATETDTPKPKSVRHWILAIDVCKLSHTNRKSNHSLCT